MTRQFFSGILLTLALIGFGALPAVAQSISTRVTDRGGLAVPGAVVTVTSDDHHEDRVTDLEGRARFHPVPPGRYEITAYVKGFRKARRTIRVDEGQNTETLLRVHRYKGDGER